MLSCQQYVLNYHSNSNSICYIYSMTFHSSMWNLFDIWFIICLIDEIIFQIFFFRPCWQLVQLGSRRRLERHLLPLPSQRRRKRRRWPGMPVGCPLDGRAVEDWKIWRFFVGDGSRSPTWKLWERWINESHFVEDLEFRVETNKIEHHIPRIPSQSWCPVLLWLHV